MRYMRKSVFVPGLVVLIIGACLLGYGFKYAGDLDALIKASEWDVTWYRVIDSYGTWGDVIGRSTLPARFGRTTIVYDDVSEEFGFKATMTIELLRDDTVVFQTGSDDGIMLYVDGELVVNSWVLRGYTLDSPVHIPLKAGTHVLELWYYQWHGASEASFDMHVEEYETARNLQTAGGGILFIGVIVTIVGFLLKPKVKI
jgi:hypothetical protein